MSSSAAEGSSTPEVEQLVKGSAGTKLDPSQDDKGESELISKQNHNKPGNSSGRVGNGSGQRQGRGNYVYGKSYRNGRGNQAAYFRGFGRGRAPSPVTRWVPRERVGSAQNTVVQEDPDLKDNLDNASEEENDSDALDGSDKDLVSDDYDSDVTQKSHGSRKQTKWFKKFFDRLDSLSIEQINEPQREWHCPACKGGPGAKDLYNLHPLLNHPMKKGFRRVKLHRELAQVLRNDLQIRGTASVIPCGETYRQWKGLGEEEKDHEIVWPPMVIIMNTRLDNKDDNDKWLGVGNQELLDCFDRCEAIRARHSYGPQGHRGMSVLIFESSATGYLEAERLHMEFAEKRFGRNAWARYSGGVCQLYGFLAAKQDLVLFNQYSQGKKRLKFEMRSYQKMVVKELRQIAEDSQQLNYFKKNLEVMSGKLRRSRDDNLMLRQITKMHLEEIRGEMDAQDRFFKESINHIKELVEEWEKLKKKGAEMYKRNFKEMTDLERKFDEAFAHLMNGYVDDADGITKDSAVPAVLDDPFCHQFGERFVSQGGHVGHDGVMHVSTSQMLPEFQIYGLSDSIKLKEPKKEDGSTQQTNGITNGINGGTMFRFERSNSLSFLGEAGTLGLTGLQNLGNTCFMNSSLQCLAHTPKIVDFFLGEYSKEINLDNPLGMKGEIALAFGDLLRSLWAPGASTVAPSTFKAKLARFAPQFSGINRHDSQELLAFLLDGLHEDLNRVRNKPYVEAKDGDGRPDAEVADEYWRNHVARNDSIIVDLCQGQYKSTLACPTCKKVSVMFDPFMYLSLPLPCTSMRTMDLTVMGADGSSLPIPLTVNVPKFGKFEDLHKALVNACSLPEDETLLVTEVYSNQIIRFLEEPTDSLTLIRDDDKLVVYRLKKDANNSPLIVYMHQKLEEQFLSGKSSPTWKAFGIPLVSRLCDVENGSDVKNLYLKLLSSFKMPAELYTENLENPTEEEASDKADTDGTTSVEITNSIDVKEIAESLPVPVLRLYLTDDRGNSIESEVMKEKPVNKSKRVNVLARWPVKELDVYDTCLLSSLPEVCKFGTKRPQETVSLYKCLEAFLTEEPLGPDDMWYCPGCKENRQAIKKLDLWRLPEILVIHLKRFSYSQLMNIKLEAYVDFPLDDLDLSSYISYKNGQTTYCYMLYAVSNHSGSMGGGHYTAYVQNGSGRWYDFDDSRVNPMGQEKIKTSAAYVLFYKRL